MFLATLGTTQQQEKVAAYLPLLTMVAAENQCPANALSVKMLRNINVFPNTFAEEDHFLSAAINFTILPPEIINKMIHYNWLTDGLELSIDKLNQCMSELNFLSPPINPADLNACSKMSRLVATATK